MYEEVRKPPKQSLLFRFFQHAFGTQASCPDPFSLSCEGMRKGSEGSGLNKEDRSDVLLLQLRIEAKTYWTFCRTLWTSFPDMFLTRAYTPVFGLSSLRNLDPGFTLHGASAYTPRCIGLRSTEHRLTLHVVSDYAPRCVRLCSTLCQTMLHVVFCRGACNVYLRTAVFCFRWLIDPTPNPSPWRGGEPRQNFFADRQIGTQTSRLRSGP